MDVQTDERGGGGGGVVVSQYPRLFFEKRR